MTKDMNLPLLQLNNGFLRLVILVIVVWKPDIRFLDPKNLFCPYETPNDCGFKTCK